MSVQQTMAEHQLDYELIIVDDGSTDSTAQVVAGFNDSKIQLISHGRNRGYGAALRTANKHASGTTVCWMDSDGQYNPRNLLYMINMIPPYDLVVGNRIKRNDPQHRKVAAMIWNALSVAFLGFVVPDLDCGFKVYTQELALLATSLSSQGNAFNVEFVYAAAQQGYKVGSVSVDSYPRTQGEAKGLSLNVGIRALKDLLRIRHKHRL